jgi:hypothetical protein
MNKEDEDWLNENFSEEAQERKAAAKQEECNKLIADLYYENGTFSFYNLEVALMNLAELHAKEYEIDSPESSKLWHVRALMMKQFITGNGVSDQNFYLSLINYKDHNACWKRKCEICSMESTSIFESDEPCKVCGSNFVTVLEKIR